MHPSKTQAFGLTCVDPDAPPPVLAGLAASGRLDGVLFELTLRQTYRNAGTGTLEVVYTFPLPYRAVLLGFASELNGERKEGAIVAKRQAERQYEAALAGGDAPVMLEALSGGLHTANIGNLKPGDEIVLEVRFAQLLAFEQGRLRLAIPTTIAPRYGHAAQAGLQPQQVPRASLEVEHTLALSITVAGALAGAIVECATHRFTRAAVEGGVRLTLAEGAKLDRDVVVLVQPREPLPSLVVQARDAVSHAAPVVLMAALQPPVAAPRERVALKLLVDCSGSMAGDSIASARTALDAALAGMGEHDQVSVSRFGSDVEHLLLPTSCTPRVLRALRQSVTGIEADLGGTDMEGALRAVFALAMKADAAGTDVLLVTDGEIWQAEEMIAVARASGHRVFAIGVGSSPAEGVLRALAEATGGACEFATPGEALEAAAGRMLVRIRQQPWRDVRIDWGVEPAWQTALPASAFGGDTVIAFAGMTARSRVARVRLLANDVRGAGVEIARGEAESPCPGDSLARIAAATRVAAADGQQALTLSTTYQLLGKHTHCILVHQRADADKAVEQGQLHRVDSMLAAGWGATGSVTADAAFSLSVSDVGVLRAMRTSPRVRDFGAYSESFSVDFLDRPAFLRRSNAHATYASLEAIATSVAEHLELGAEVREIASRCESLQFHAEVRSALDQAVALGATEGEALVLLAHWTNSRKGGLGSSSIAASLQPHLDALSAGLLAPCVELFERLLSVHAIDDWSDSGAQRLQRALASGEWPKTGGKSR